ncbi:site-specific DNA-methyltransferase [Spirochaetota bacterium]
MTTKYTEDKQQKLNLKVKEKIDRVEEYKFEKLPKPIRGYPELHWAGKRSFRSTLFYPAQLKENHGEPIENWMNEIYWGDNLQVMSHLLKKYRGKVQLVYVDPPYDSNANYKLKVKVKGNEINNDYNTFEEKQYSDIWTNDDYLQFMYERLILIKELLSDNGSIFLHCDWRKTHHLRCIMNEVFGTNNLVNEIWKSTTFAGSSKAIANKYPINHNTIYWYCKNGKYIFNKIYLPYSDEYLKRFTNPDNDPKGPWQSNALKTFSQDTFNRLKREGELISPKSKGAGWRYKFYLKDTKGRIIETIWEDIYLENPMAKVRTNYPTQKPEALLERIIKASSNSGDIVFDCFMGSGTTQAVAMKLGRRFIGADINLGAIQITTKRLLNIAKELKNNEKDKQGKLIKEEDENKQIDNYYTGFSVFNVNNYDIFRNPVQAKELLIEALEIQPLPGNNIYDGEKDGRMVKIMPINRIATRADLNDLITGFDYKAFEKLNSKNPNEPVERLMLVCMGHEPDLKAHLENGVKYKLDIEVVDILRDRGDLEFKRDSEAEIIMNKGKLEIKRFYPMNLLQKLSLRKDKVKKWHELVESVMIDWNYDGAVFEPALVDVPEKKELVKGKYKVPDDAGNIRVKITDLLSESLEIDIINH